LLLLLIALLLTLFFIWLFFCGSSRHSDSSEWTRFVRVVDDTDDQVEKMGRITDSGDEVDVSEEAWTGLGPQAKLWE
jgi:hypothetical protein